MLVVLTSPARQEVFGGHSRTRPPPDQGRSRPARPRVPDPKAAGRPPPPDAGANADAGRDDLPVPPPGAPREHRRRRPAADERPDLCPVGLLPGPRPAA